MTSSRTFSYPERLARFLAAYRAVIDKPSNPNAAALTERLSAFLEAYRRCRPNDPSPRAMPGAIDRNRLSAVLSALHGPLAHARAQGVLLNPWVMAGLGRNEVRNAAVLASFFSPLVCGHLAVDFLNAFLEPLRSDRAIAIPSRLDLEAGYHVRTEHYVAGSDRDRVDLTIEGLSFVLGIEVKIGAQEGQSQLERYVESIERWGRIQGKSAAIVFLAPYPAGRADVSSTTWRSVITASFKVIASARADRTDTQRLLHLFARHMATF